MKSDAEIRTDVQNELQWDPSVDEKQIGVTVKAGVVTLVGEVHHYADRFSAEQAAKRVVGVRAIANDLGVKPQLPGERSDTDIATAAANALQWNSALAGLPIKAIVKQGWLTLTGQVQFGFQKTAAEGAVRYLLGVKSLSNDITVKPAARAGDVKQKIEAAFQRQAHLDATEITVLTENDKVTLSGTVHSWREKDDATVAAWRAPGVASVENRLQVQY